MNGRCNQFMAQQIELMLIGSRPQGPSPWIVAPWKPDFSQGFPLLEQSQQISNRPMTWKKGSIHLSTVTVCNWFQYGLPNTSAAGLLTSSQLASPYISDLLRPRVSSRSSTKNLLDIQNHSCCLNGAVERSQDNKAFVVMWWEVRYVTNHSTLLK